MPTLMIHASALCPLFRGGEGKDPETHGEGLASVILWEFFVNTFLSAKSVGQHVPH